MKFKSFNTFDQFAIDYSRILDKSIAISGEESSYFTELKIKLMHQYLGDMSKTRPRAKAVTRERVSEVNSLTRMSRVFLSMLGNRNNLTMQFAISDMSKDKLRILDFGCGTGRASKFVNKLFPNSYFFGIDLSAESIRYAKKNFHDRKNRFLTMTPNTKLKSKYYDIAFSSVVFHHISLKERKKTLINIYNSLKDGGYFFLFEHNPYNPITVKIVNNCPFDKNAKLLTPIYAKNLIASSDFIFQRLVYYFFFPRFLSIFRPLEKYLSFLPFGGQYMIVCKKHNNEQ